MLRPPAAALQRNRRFCSCAVTAAPPLSTETVSVVPVTDAPARRQGCDFPQARLEGLSYRFAAPLLFAQDSPVCVQAQSLPAIINEASNGRAWRRWSRSQLDEIDASVRAAADGR